MQNRIHKTRWYHHPDRRGAMLVEFALTFPVIVLFFFGILEMGRAMLLQHSADTAAYEGARSAMVPGATSTDARNAAIDLLQAANVGTYTITVTPTTIEEDTALISVRVDVPINENSWVIPSFLTDMTLSSEVTLFTERPPIVKLSGVPAMKIKKTKAMSGASG